MWVMLMVAVSTVMLWVLGPAGADSIRFHVAPGGSDTWSGRLPAPNAARTDGPFATLERARDAVRELKAQGGLRQPVDVLLHEGTYYLSEPFRLSSQDSGTRECPITYKAAPGERPVLSGGKVITGWQPYRGKIMRAQLPEAKGGKWKFRQLFFNARRQVRARYPNLDPDNPLYGGWAFVESLVPEDAERPTAFGYDPDVFTRKWAKPEQGELFIFPWLCWVNDIVPIRQVDQRNHLIHLARSPWDPLMVGNRFYVENILEELDQPGEWCLDSETGTLYFWPPDGTLDDGVVVAPENDRLIELRGTPEAPIAYIGIEGLTFTQTLSLSLVRGYAVQSDGFALYLENAEDCRIAGNVFDQVGGDAIRLENHTARNRIVNNEIAYAGAHGICFHGSGGGNTHTWYKNTDILRQMAAEKAVAADNIVSRNHIHHCGVLEKHAGGVFFFNINAVDNVISHNFIHDVPRYGISLQIGLGGNVIEYNELRHLSLETADTAGIETNRWFVLEEDERFSRGNVFRHNLVCDVVGCMGTLLLLGHLLGQLADGRNHLWQHCRGQRPRRCHDSRRG